MDDRDEQRGSSAHSSVGGIYRLNRTVSTCLCHFLELLCRCVCVRVCVYACLHLLVCVRLFSPLSFGDVATDMGEYFVCEHSLYSRLCNSLLLSRARSYDI